MRFFITGTVFGLISLLPLPVAQAGPLVCAYGVCTASVDTGLLATDFEITLDFPLFDPTVGSLTEYDIVLAARMVILPGGTASAVSLDATQFSVTQMTIFTLSDLTNSGRTLSGPISSVSFNQLYSFSGYLLDPFGPADVTDVSEDADTTNLDKFVGQGFDMLSVKAQSSSSGSIGNGQGNVSGISTEAELTVDLTYEYVPEPGAVEVLISGLVIIGWFRRR